MISFEKAKQGKRLMKQFIADGELEKSSVYWTDVSGADPGGGCGNTEKE